MTSTLAIEVPVSVFADESSDAFATYEADLSFTGRLMAGVPVDPKMIEGWLRSRAGIAEDFEVQQMLARTLRELGADEPTMADLEAASEEIAQVKETCAFKCDGEGLYIEERQVKAMLKEATNINFAKEKWGKTGKGPMGFVAERVFVEPGKLSLKRSEAAGVHMQVGHLKGPKGPYSTLGYHEYVEDVELSLRVRVLDDSITPQQWARIWVVAEKLGLGALRSQGFGKFIVTRWERT